MRKQITEDYLINNGFILDSNFEYKKYFQEVLCVVLNAADPECSFFAVSIRQFEQDENGNITHEECVFPCDVKYEDEIESLWKSLNTSYTVV